MAKLKKGVRGCNSHFASERVMSGQACPCAVVAYCASGIQSVIKTHGMHARMLYCMFAPHPHDSYLPSHSCPPALCPTRTQMLASRPSHHPQATPRLPTNAAAQIRQALLPAATAAARSAQWSLGPTTTQQARGFQNAEVQIRRGGGAGGCRRCKGATAAPCSASAASAFC
eukprot:scaffold122064_cov15-Tisochrysis_lutea.AAC.1